MKIPNSLNYLLGHHKDSYVEIVRPSHIIEALWNPVKCFDLSNLDITTDIIGFLL